MSVRELTLHQRRMLVIALYAGRIWRPLPLGEEFDDLRKRKLIDRCPTPWDYRGDLLTEEGARCARLLADEIGGWP